MRIAFWALSVQQDICVINKYFNLAISTRPKMSAHCCGFLCSNKPTSLTEVRVTVWLIYIAHVPANYNVVGASMELYWSKLKKKVYT